MSVLIMMTTYNGETYLRAQLDSLLAQDNGDFTLAVQDDGSTDATNAILEEYATHDKRIRLFSNNSGRHGVFFNFHTLINRFKTDSEQFDRYMFCDQDDIWLPHKISAFLAAMDRQPDGLPALLYADMNLIDKDGSVTCESLNRLYGLDGKNLYSVFFSHKLYGCNLMMNRELFQRIPPIDLNLPGAEILSHDNLAAKYAMACGTMQFIPEVLMSYRRYGGNVTAEQSYRPGISRIVSRALKFSDLASDHARTYNQSLIAIAMMRHEHLSAENRSALKAVLHHLIHGGPSAVRFAGQHHIIWGKPVENISRLTTLSLGAYRPFLLDAASLRKWSDYAADYLMKTANA